MKLASVHREVEQSGTMQVAKATIKSSPKIFDFFANQTYANKPVAICRELVANAIDAHVAAGCPDRPVEVHMPTSLDPIFRVRDFGTGMSHEFVMGPFMAYTDGSTKDQSNDQIGGFGIGSKSPFAYCDQFTLRVVHQGVLSVYTMFKDEDGIPAIGLQGQKSTDEHNGVEVSFPVEDEDMNTFRDAAQTALQYFRPLPLVENGTLNPPEYTFQGNGWGLRNSAGPLGVIMGGVRYPVEISSLEYSLRGDSRLSPLLGYGIDLTLPIGACSVALSREALSYDKVTSQGIEAGLEAIIQDVVTTFATMFDNEPTLWAAKTRLYNESGMTNPYAQNARQKLLASNAKYKGKTLTTNISIVDMKGFELWHIEQKPHWGKTKSHKSSDWRSPSSLRLIIPGVVGHVIVDDLPRSPKSKTMKRIQEYVEKVGRDKGILCLRGSLGKELTSARIAAIVRLIGSPEIILTSTLPEPVTTAKQAKVLNVRPKVRMFTFNGRTTQGWPREEITNLTPGWAKQHAVQEIPYKDQPDKGILVVMNSFDLPVGFHQKMNTGLVAYDELLFVNKADADKLDGFDKFEDVFSKRLEAKLKTMTDAPERVALGINNNILSELFRFVKHTGIQYATLSRAQQNRPFGKIVKLYEDYVQHVGDDETKLQRFITPKNPARVDPEKLYKDFVSKQKDAWLLSTIISTNAADQISLFTRNI